MSCARLPQAASCGQAASSPRAGLRSCFPEAPPPRPARGCWQEPGFLAPLGSPSSWCCRIGLPPRGVMRGSGGSWAPGLGVTHHGGRTAGGKSPWATGELAPWGRPGQGFPSDLTFSFKSPFFTPRIDFALLSRIGCANLWVYFCVSLLSCGSYGSMCLPANARCLSAAGVHCRSCAHRVLLPVTRVQN